MASRPASRRPCCTIVGPSCCWWCLVGKLDTMPQEGAFMERPFAVRAGLTTTRPGYATALLTQSRKSKSSQPDTQLHTPLRVATAAGTRSGRACGSVGLDRPLPGVTVTFQAENGGNRSRGPTCLVQVSSKHADRTHAVLHSLAVRHFARKPMELLANQQAVRVQVGSRSWPVHLLLVDTRIGLSMSGPIRLPCS